MSIQHFHGTDLNRLSSDAIEKCPHTTRHGLSQTNYITHSIPQNESVMSRVTCWCRAMSVSNIISTESINTYGPILDTSVDLYPSRALRQSHLAMQYASIQASRVRSLHSFGRHCKPDNWTAATDHITCIHLTTSGISAPCCTSCGRITLVAFGLRLRPSQSRPAS